MITQSLLMESKLFPVFPYCKHTQHSFFPYDVPRTAPSWDVSGTETPMDEFLQGKYAGGIVQSLGTPCNLTGHHPTTLQRLPSSASLQSCWGLGWAPNW